MVAKCSLNVMMMIDDDKDCDFTLLNSFMYMLFDDIGVPPSGFYIYVLCKAYPARSQQALWPDLLSGMARAEIKSDIVFI